MTSALDPVILGDTTLVSHRPVFKSQLPTSQLCDPRQVT